MSIFLGNSPEAFYERELHETTLQERRFGKYPVPDFDLGLHWLGLKHKNEIPGFVNSWFKNPEHYLKHSRLSPVKKWNGFFEFDSILDPSQTARFKYHLQPNGTPGRKVALIHVMHWNGRLSYYEYGINSIRATLLPISTLIHIPAGRGLNPGAGDPPDFDAVSPCVGKIVWKARQDILDLQNIALFLKQELGFHEVGLFSYSLGSLRSCIAALIHPGLFDSGVFHLVADDFAEALMHGVGTRHIAHKIEGMIEPELLTLLLKTVFPGAYEDRFYKLPRATRIVQANRDYVFRKPNVDAFTEKVLRVRKDTEVEIANLSHDTLGSFPRGYMVMLRNIRFIYENTLMKKCKRSRLFGI